jgi:hypothetical protein
VLFPTDEKVLLGQDGGLAAIEEAGEDVWQLDVRWSKGGAANKLGAEDIAGTAKNVEVFGMAEMPASLPLLSPSLPLFAI